jgi:hypothetical protein
MAKAEAKKAEGFMSIDSSWKIDPASVPAKDGSKIRYTIQHRMGPPGVDKKDLFFITGLEDRLTDARVRIKKEVRGEANQKKLIRSEKSDLAKALSDYIRSYREYLHEFYLEIGIRPIFQRLPEDPNDPKAVKKFQIPGFYNLKTLKPVLGDIGMVTLALEMRNADLKDSVDEYRENQMIAKNALELPNLNKDLENRLSNIVAGTVSKQYLLERVKGEGEGK